MQCVLTSVVYFLFKIFKNTIQSTKNRQWELSPLSHIVSPNFVSIIFACSESNCICCFN